MTTTASRSWTLLAALGLAAALLIALWPKPSLALPAYAAATGQPCSTCHVNPAGGGALTAIGTAFAAIPTHSTNPAAAFAQVSAPAATTTTTTAAAPAATTAAAPAAAATTAAPAAALPKSGEPSTIAIGIGALLLIAIGLGMRKFALQR